MREEDVVDRDVAHVGPDDQPVVVRLVGLMRVDCSIVDHCTVMSPPPSKRSTVSSTLHDAVTWSRISAGLFESWIASWKFRGRRRRLGVDGGAGGGRGG